MEKKKKETSRRPPFENIGIDKHAHKDRTMNGRSVY